MEIAAWGQVVAIVLTVVVTVLSGILLKINASIGVLRERIAAVEASSTAHSTHDDTVHKNQESKMDLLVEEFRAARKESSDQHRELSEKMESSFRRVHEKLWDLSGRPRPREDGGDE